MLLKIKELAPRFGAPSQAGAEAGLFDLPAAGRAIVAMLALGPSRTGVIGAMAQLADTSFTDATP